MPPLRGAGRTLTGAAGALLTPRLDAAAADLCAGQSALRALTLVGEVRLDDFMKNVRVDLLAKDVIGKLDLADRFSGDVVNCYFRHERFLLPYFTVLLTETMLPFAPGMAPLTNRRFRSASTRTISRFCTVTFSLPM